MVDGVRRARGSDVGEGPAGRGVSRSKGHYWERKKEVLFAGELLA